MPLRPASTHHRIAHRIVFLLLLTAVGQACGQAGAQAPSVSVEAVSREAIVQEVRVTGTVTSPRRALLSASVAGLIAEMDLDAGDPVEAGDRLVQLDDELERLALEQAQAATAEASAALDDARRLLEEGERLVSDRSIAETEVRSRRATVAMREAAHQAALAETRRQQARVRRHQVQAPFSGVIVQRLAELGEWVNPGDGLMELAATEGLRFDFRVSQEYFPRLHADTRVDLRVDALPGDDFAGRIQSIVPVSDAAARTFLVRVLATRPPEGVTAGMSARGSLFLDTGRQEVVIPRDALLRYPDGRTTVWVVQAGQGDHVVEERQVDVGLESGGRIEVRGGLQPGDRVVTRGNESLQDGQTVQVR